MPYADIESLDAEERIEKILSIVRGRSVVLMEGRLKPQEEAKLIQTTMSKITKGFRGIELCTIYPEAKNVDLFKKLKRNFTSMVLGDREGITLIGPASVVKAIRKDPDKIQLFSFNLKK